MATQIRIEHEELALLTPAQMGEADCTAEAVGVRGADMMEPAGGAVAVAIGERWPMRPVAVLCGPGNNDGDGFVAARHLDAAGWPVTVALLGAREKLSGEAAPFTPDCLDGPGMIVDAIFGAGLSRPPDGKAQILVEAMKSRKVTVCAVDVPSGLDGASWLMRGVAAPADLTVTFFRKKFGHLLYPGQRLCGDIVVADIRTPLCVLDAIAPNTWEDGPGLWLDGYLPTPSCEQAQFDGVARAASWDTPQLTRAGI